MTFHLAATVADVLTPALTGTGTAADTAVAPGTQLGAAA